MSEAYTYTPAPCPHCVEDIDLFAPGAQAHWYDAYALLQGLGLAHMDAAVRDDSRARTFMAQDLVAVMADRGVKVTDL